MWLRISEKKKFASGKKRNSEHIIGVQSQRYSHRTPILGQGDKQANGRVECTVTPHPGVHKTSVVEWRGGEGRWGALRGGERRARGGREGRLVWHIAGFQVQLAWQQRTVEPPLDRDQEATSTGRGCRSQCVFGLISTRMKLQLETHGFLVFRCWAPGRKFIKPLFWPVVAGGLARGRIDKLSLIPLRQDNSFKISKAAFPRSQLKQSWLLNAEQRLNCWDTAEVTPHRLLST